MNENNSMQIRIPLDTGRRDKGIAIPHCHEIIVIGASSVDATVDIKTQENDFLPMATKCRMVWTQKVSKLYLRNEAQADAFLEILCINYGSEAPEKFVYETPERSIVEGIASVVDIAGDVSVTNTVDVSGSNVTVSGSVVTGSGNHGSHKAVSVGTSAVKIVNLNPNRKRLHITPMDGDLFIGGAGVTPNTGTPVLGGRVLDSSAEWWGVSANDAIDVRILEELI